MLVNPREGQVKAGVVLIPKRLHNDAAVMHSAQSIANTGFVVKVANLSPAPVALEDISSDQLSEYVDRVVESAEELKRTLPNKRIGAVGAWIAGTLYMLASERAFDAGVVISSPVHLPERFETEDPLAVVQRANTPTLAVYGELDDQIPPQDVRELEMAFTSSHLDHEVYTYAGVGHAFFDNEEGNSEYREPAERDLWMRLDRFFESHI